MTQPSILVIDDEPDNFDVIEALLSPQEYQLHYVAGGSEAIAALETLQPDLILLDVMMPGIDGIEVCQRIKAMPQWQPVPIIMVTALTAKEDLARCLRAGADDFISKPINSLELRARVRSMLRIKHQYDDLQALLDVREDMVKMIIHDLRSPLTSILLGLQLVTSVESSQEKQRHRLTKIQSAAQNLQVLVDDLLKIALFESGKIHLNRTDTDLCSLIQSAVSNFQTIASQKNLSLVSQLPKEPPTTISVDANMIHRTLDNLLANAIKWSPPNSQITIKSELSPSGDSKIQVIDTGPGVPDALQQQIFEKYEIGTLMPSVSQIGLGLAFCKMVVEAHGGNIWVRNNQPQGAIFEITLAA